jgi:cytochrome c oxidase assembly protein subunit 15
MITTARTQSDDRNPDPDRMRPVRIWLQALAVMIAAMVVLGGATRLTDSGLSITEWQPLLGAIPPLSEADWQQAFAKYQQIPEAKTVNQGMTLEAFKTIYWWEWSHRLFGRLIGVVFLVPFVWLWWRGLIGRDLWPKLVGLFVLGGLQGAAGWYMVASGLVDRVDVSQYRLALHLGLAVLILAMVLWLSMDLGRRTAATPRPAAPHLVRIGWGLLALVFVQILLGALVAGTDAGFSHNTWPLMDGAWVPSGLFVMSPWWANLFENVLTVQFNHRMAGYALAGLAALNVWLVWRSSGAPPELRTSAGLLLAAVLAQIALGVWTLLAHVPIGLGLLHQAGALVVLALALRHVHGMRLSRSQSMAVG